MNKSVRIILQLAFAAAALGLLWIAGVNPYNLLMCFWWPLLTVLQMAVLLFFFSSLPYRHLFAALGLGASAVPLATFLIQKPLNLLLEGTRFQYLMGRFEALGTINLQAPLIAPLTEEITKMLPVAFFVILLMKYKKYRLLSPIDFALLGLAAGAGFDIFENICRFMNGYYDVLGFYRTEVMEPIPGVFGLYLFPCMIKSEYLGNPMIWFGHAGLTGAISLAFGFFIYLKKKRYIILPVAAYILCAFDHSMWNWYQPYPEQKWAKILPALTLYGRLIPILFAFGLLAAIFMLMRNRKRFKALLKKTDHPERASAGIRNKLDSAIRGVRRRNQLANAFRHYIKRGVKGEPFDVVTAELAGLLQPLPARSEPCKM